MILEGDDHRRSMTKVITVGKNELYNRDNLVGPFLVHKLLGPRPPPSPILILPYAPPPLLIRGPAQVTVITTGIPLIVCVVVLLFYEPVVNVIWYLSLLTSTLMAVSAAFVIARKDFSAVAAQLVPIDIGLGMLIAGVSGVALCLILWFVARQLDCMRECVHGRQLRNEHRRMTDIETSKERETAKVAWARWGVWVGRGCAFVVAGLVASRVLPLPWYTAADMGSLGGFVAVLGVILVGVGVLELGHALLWLLQPFRQFWWELRHFFSRHFMRILLLIVAALYLPVMQNIMAVFNCRDAYCPKVVLDPTAHCLLPHTYCLFAMPCLSPCR